MNEYYQKDLYKILGVSPDCDVVKIKAAYRKQARIWHPDVNDNSQESIVRFKEITEAYEVLTDSHKRSQYDILKGFNIRKEASYASKTAEQSAKKAYNESSSATTGEKTYTYTKYEYEKKTTEDKKTKSAQNTKEHEKGSFSQVFENILDGLFTGGSSGKNKQPNVKKNQNQNKNQNKKGKPENGRDINLNVNIKMSEAITGTHRTVNVLHTEKCPKCEGRRFINGSKCPLCKGTGEISIHKKLNVKIPAGIKKGSKIRVANEGNKGYNGGRDGDLYLYIEIEESAFFKYEGINVHCEIPITPFEAVLGASIEVPTLCGNVSMKIPPNTSTGQKFRLSEQGVYDEKNRKKGDQIVVVKIEVPKEMSREEIKLYEQLKNISTHKVRENLLNE